MSMFCYQCQETAKGSGCTLKGVCGKSDTVANLQDLLVYTAKGVSFFAHIATETNVECAEADRYVFDAMFITITNANFDDARIIEKIKEGLQIRNALRSQLLDKRN